MSTPIIAIVGATGTGKSDLSLELAQRLRERGCAAEIVGADAMQLYRGMDIGTAKLTLAERRGIPHHCVDVLDVTREASVAEYQVMARTAIEGILERGAVPIVVGGSGLYVSAVLFDFRFPARDADVRARLEAELERIGAGMLHRRLLELDPVAARAIGPHNGRRIVRALEVIEVTGEPFDVGLAEAPWRPAVTLGLRLPREMLVARLDERVRRMWSAGLVDEVRALLPLGLQRGATSRRAIGYAQAIAQVHGECTEAEAIEQTAALTRRYARRQVSWFRRYRDVHWLEADAPDVCDQAWAVVAAALDRPGGH